MPIDSSVRLFDVKVTFLGCDRDLLKSGYFFVDGEYYCNDDYHKLMGIKCVGCGKYVEGEAISVFNSTFHPDCFGCSQCGLV